MSSIPGTTIRKKPLSLLLLALLFIEEPNTNPFRDASFPVQ
jgi:hypothetical protein